MVIVIEMIVHLGIVVVRVIEMIVVIEEIVKEDHIHVIVMIVGIKDREDQETKRMSFFICFRRRTKKVSKCDY